MQTEFDTLTQNHATCGELFTRPGRIFAAPASYKTRNFLAMSSGSNKIRVLLADDHVLMRVGLNEVIRREPDMEVVAEAGDGIEAVYAYRKYLPDVVITDLRMPRQGGIETICKLREAYEDAHILVYSNSTNQDQIHASFRSGASGYIVKSMPLDELPRGIRAVAQGAYYIPTQILACLGLSRTLSLTSLEMGILALAAKGMNNQEIGFELQLSENAVRTYMSSILAKMDVSDRNQAVLAGVRRGLLQVL